jgi:ATP-dependent RNA helicase MSS116, mitochondrial
MLPIARRCAASLPKCALKSLATRSTFAALHIQHLRRHTNPLATYGTASFHTGALLRQYAAAAVATQQYPGVEDSSSYTNTEASAPITEFQQLADRGLIHPTVVRTITKSMRMTTMTEVQSKTINEALSGVDL